MTDKSHSMFVGRDYVHRATERQLLLYIELYYSYPIQSHEVNVVNWTNNQKENTNNNTNSNIL